MDIDFRRVCVYTVLLNAIYYYESDGMVVAVICVAWDVILHTHTHLHNTDECEGVGGQEVDSS